MVSKVSCLEIENNFKLQLQDYVAKIDSEKACLLAQLEKELNVRQEVILESARQRIDDLNEEANRLKLVRINNYSFHLINSFYFFLGCS
jgi:vacuolar-type H+-ATPase subunit H